MNNKIKEYLIIVIGSLLYAIGTVVFVFPHSVLLGGTSGISVIISHFGTLSPGTILNIINLLLMVTAFIILGKSMAVKTFLGSLFTTVFIALCERIASDMHILVTNALLSAIIGAILIAVAGGLLFSVNSSSGGTDILALIIKKFSNMSIGKALLVTDISIVILGGFLSGWLIMLCSVVGIFIKTLGTDLVIKTINTLNLSSISET